MRVSLGSIGPVGAQVLRAITRLYPLNTPRTSILSRLPAIPPEYGPFHGKRGDCYAGYDNDEVCQSLFWFGDFDPWVVSTIRRLARPGSVGLDVGANIGAVALTLGKAVGPQGRVFCFEPMPPNIAHLKRNIAANALHWIEVEPIALSDNHKQLRMILPKDHAGMSRVVSANNGGLWQEPVTRGIMRGFIASGGAAEEKDTFVVNCTTLDQWLSERGRLDISVCKIDVEGHEIEVFAGMERALSDRAISAFLFERHIAHTVRNDPIFDLLTSKGYRVLRIEKGLRRVHYVDIGSPLKARPTHDFVAVLPQSEALLWR
jgi:FkbM family methyltransferase